MAEITGGRLEQEGLTHLYDVKYYGNNRLPDILGNNHIESDEINNIGSLFLNQKKGYITFDNSYMSFKNITDTSFSLMITFKVSDTITNQTLISQHNFIKVFIESGSVKARLSKAGEASTFTVSKPITADTWHTVKVTVDDQTKLYLWLDNHKNPSTSTPTYTVASSNMCFFGVSDSSGSKSNYLDGLISNIAYYNQASLAKPETFKFYSITINKQLTLGNFTQVGGASSIYDIDGLVLAYDATNSSSFTSGGSTLYNVAGVNSHLSMSVVGAPTIVSGAIEFRSGDYAEGDYDAFTEIFPNEDLSTQTSSFSVIGVFSGVSTDSHRGSIFEFGYRPNLKIAYQYSNGGSVSTYLSGRTGDALSWNHNESSTAYAGDGINYVSEELGNRFVDEISMLGYTGEYRSDTSDYLVRAVIDGKYRKSWNPPTNVYNSSDLSGSIDWDWHESSWAKRKPVINAGSTTGTPSSFNGTDFRGLYIFNRVITEDEMDDILQHHS